MKPPPPAIIPGGFILFRFFPRGQKERNSPYASARNIESLYRDILRGETNEGTDDGRVDEKVEG